MAYPKASSGFVGKSAYQTAVEMGFQGSEAEWIATSQQIAGLVHFSLLEFIPDGYLVLDGGEYDSTLYANLFAKIGNRFGVGSQPHLFRVPDARGKIPIFADMGAGHFTYDRRDRGDGTTGDAVGTIQGFQFGVDSMVIANEAAAAGIYIENMNFVPLIKY